MRPVKKVGWLLLVGLVAIQFIQPARNKSGQDTLADISRTISISPVIGKLLKTACFDCHSNNTDYPWYASVQPMGWVLNKHISNGKQELNFNEFGSYSLRRRMSKLKSIASQVKENEMPLSSYVLMHKEAKLSEEDKTMLTDWAVKALDSLEARQY